MRVAVNNHALPVYKKTRITSLLCIFESTIRMYFQSEWKTVWIQFRWLRQKPADLDPHCFQNKIYPISAGKGLM